MASQIRVSPNIEGIPQISQGARTPITSAGGQGGAGLGTIGYNTSSTDLTGAGALLGGLMSSVIGRGGSGANNVIKNAVKQNVTDPNAPIPVNDPATGQPVGSMQPNTRFAPPGGYPNPNQPIDFGLRGNVQQNGSQADALLGGMRLGSDGNLLRSNIELTGEFTKEGDPIGEVQSGIFEGEKVVQKANNIFETLSDKTLLDQTGTQVYPNYRNFESATGSPLTSDTNNLSFLDRISPDYSIGANFDPVLGQSDLYTGGGYDPSLDNIGDFAFDSQPTIDIAGLDGGGFDFGDMFNFDNSYFDDSSNWMGDIGSSIGDTFADIGSGFGDFFGSFFAKDGGLATPLFAEGGDVRGYADGSAVTLADNVVSDPNSPTGYSMYSVPVTADGVVVDIGAYGSPSASSGILSGLGNILSGGIGNTLVGAGLGAGIGSLLGNQTSTSTTGVDMSKIGQIAPRTTSFGMGPARVVPYSQYGTPAASTSDYSQLMESLGAPTKMADGGSTYYTFGKEVDPLQNLNGYEREGQMQNMKTGGLPKASTPMTPEGRHDYRQGAYVDGIGDGQSDDIPAMLADGEYVIDSETVSALGNGSNKAGAKVLDQFRHGVRSHKRSAPLDKIPPKAKSPLEYIRMGAKMKGAK